MPQADPPNKSWFRRWIWELAAGLAVAGLAILLSETQGFGLWRPRGPAPLSLYGNVDIREVSLGFRVAGRMLAMPLDEGDHATSGTLLATLDPDPFRERLAASSAKLAGMQAAYAKAIAGNRPQDIAAAEAQLANQEATLVNAEAMFRRRQSLVRSGDASREDTETMAAAYHSAQAAVDQARQALSLSRAGTRVEDIDAARADMQAAAADRAAAQTELDDTRLLAPSDGTINVRATEPGAIVAAGATVFTLTIDRPLRVRAYVSEPELGRVKPGQAVQIRTDGGGRAYAGTIGFISTVAEFTPKTVETTDLRVDLVYRLRIIVTDPDEHLRQGQPVTVLVVEPQETPR